MSPRERPAPHGRPAIGYPAAVPPPGGPPGAADRSPPWDDLFSLLPPDQRDPLLALAARQGALAAEQIPPPPADAARARLTRLLAGDVHELPPPEPAGPADDLPADLDPQQRAAVATALATPDLCLI